MKKLKKILRVAGLVMLIALAAFGIGFIGGAPIPVNKRRENIIEMRIELKESDENKTETLVFKKQE